VKQDDERTVDSMAFRILGYANPGRDYFALLARMIDSSDDEDWQRRVISAAYRGSDHAKSFSSIEPFFRWLEANLFSRSDGDPPAKLVEYAAECYFWSTGESRTGT
jgi:hypothetical protein